MVDDQSIRRNASTSPLLKLPGEIREKIFSFVVGHQFIHLLYREKRFSHTVCTATASEDEVYEQFARIPSNDFAEYHSTRFGERHLHCTFWKLKKSAVLFYGKQYDPLCLSGLMTAEEPRKPMLDLSILGSCRQIYEEANMLLWTSNTFSFADSKTLKIFADGLHSTQIKKLARMHIDHSTSLWERTFGLSFISRLSGLRTLHTTLESPRNSNCPERSIYTLLRGMQLLPLQHVTVVVHRGSLNPHEKPANHWRTLAENIRSKLLDPNGPEILAAEMRAEEEWQRDSYGRMLLSWALPEMDARS